MTGSSIFDSSFQTALPQLNTEKQLLAMAMRDNALNFKPVIDSLKGVGKVFSDAEGNLKKANTAAAQRYLENMSWEDRLALEKKGDPLMTLAQEGIPLDLADAELNKAYSDSRTKARKDKTADWVATKLPMIGYNDWVSYMKGDNPYLFSSYGVDEDMDFVNNPDLRKAVEDSMQNNANRFLMDFDASHNITPSEAIRENMTIDQLRYARASDSERSVLAKATKDFADVQTRTNDLADQLWQREQLINTPDRNFEDAGKTRVNGSNTQGTDSQNAFDAYVDDFSESFADSWVRAHTDPTHTLYQDYANSNDVEGYINALAEADPTLFDNSLGIDNKVLQKKVIKKLKSMDFDSRIHDDTEQRLSVEDADSAIAEYNRLKQFAPNTAEKRKENTIKYLAQDIRSELSEDTLKQLENPNPATVTNIAKQLKRDYAERLGVNEDDDYFKDFISPAIDKALAGRQKVAQEDVNAELAANAESQKQAIEQLVNDPYVQRATGSSASKNTLKEDLLTKESLGRIQGRTNSIKEILPKEVIPIYEACSEDGQKILLHLALIGGFGTDLETFDKYDDDVKLTEIGKLKGNRNLSGLTKTAKLVKQAFPKTRQEKESADDTAKKLFDSAANH